MFTGLRKKKVKTKTISNPTKCNAASAGPTKLQQDRMIDMMLEAFQERDDATTREILRKLVQLSGGTMDWSFRKDKSSQVSMLVSKKLSYFEVLDLTIWKAPPSRGQKQEEARIRELEVPPFEQLILAVRENNIERVTQLIAERPRDVKEYSLVDQITPLHEAARVGSVEIVELLLAHDAPVDAMDYRLRTPLHYAADKGDVEVAKLLIAAGANLNARDERRVSPLHLASESGNANLPFLLVREGANINARDDLFETALHHAVNKRNISTVDALLSLKADQTICDSQGRTALHLAARRRHSHIAAMLCNAGSNVNARCDIGLSPLHYAAAAGCDSVVSYFLSDTHANPRAMDVDGRCPHQIAVSKHSAMELFRAYSERDASEEDKYVEPLFHAEMSLDLGKHMAMVGGCDKGVAAEGKSSLPPIVVETTEASAMPHTQDVAKFRSSTLLGRAFFGSKRFGRSQKRIERGSKPVTGQSCLSPRDGATSPPPLQAPDDIEEEAAGSKSPTRLSQSPRRLSPNASPRLSPRAGDVEKMENLKEQGHIFKNPEARRSMERIVLTGTPIGDGDAEPKADSGALRDETEGACPSDATEPIETSSEMESEGNASRSTSANVEVTAEDWAETGEDAYGENADAARKTKAKKSFSQKRKEKKEKKAREKEERDVEKAKETERKVKEKELKATKAKDKEKDKVKEKVKEKDKKREKAKEKVKDKAKEKEKEKEKAREKEKAKEKEKEKVKEKVKEKTKEKEKSAKPKAKDKDVGIPYQALRASDGDAVLRRERSKSAGPRPGADSTVSAKGMEAPKKKEKKWGIKLKTKHDSTAVPQRARTARDRIVSGSLDSVTRGPTTQPPQADSADVDDEEVRDAMARDSLMRLQKRELVKGNLKVFEGDAKEEGGSE